MRLYRLLLRVYPAWFRDRFELEILDAFADDGRLARDRGGARCGSGSRPSPTSSSAPAPCAEAAVEPLPIPRGTSWKRSAWSSVTRSSSSFAARGFRSPPCCRWPSASVATRRSSPSPTGSSSTPLRIPTPIVWSRSVQPSRACRRKSGSSRQSRCRSTRTSARRERSPPGRCSISATGTSQEAIGPSG